MRSIRVFGQSLALAAALFAGNVAAAEKLVPQAACLNGTATKIAANPKLYVKKELKPKCSANMNIYYAQTDMGLVMAVNSNKGRHTYVGSSMVGKLTMHKGCASACTAVEAEAAVRDLLMSGVLN